MYEQLEDWYDRHPPASFGEIEAEAPRCDKCGEELEFEGYRRWGIHGLEGDRELERAYDVCPNCTGETVFPLAQKLKLRADHWSEQPGKGYWEKVFFSNDIQNLIYYIVFLEIDD